MDKSTSDHVRKKTQEAGDQEVSDVQPVHIGVGRYNHSSVAKTLYIFLDIQGAHQVENLVVLVDDGAIQIPNIQGFTFQGKDRLKFRVATAGNRPRGGLAFGDEDHRIVPGLLLKIQVSLAILKLRYSERNRRGSFPCEFANVLQLFAQSPG